MGTKPPAAQLGRKNNTYIVPAEFCKHFYTSSMWKGEERGSQKEFTWAIDKG